MPFVVTDRYVFTVPVAVLVPVDGGHVRQDFTATFKVLPVEEQGAFDLGTPDGSTGFLKTVVVGLGDLVDENKNEVPYSDTLRDQLIQWHFARLPLVNAYFDAVRKAPEGN